MTTRGLTQRIGRKKSNKEKIAAEVIRNPSLLPELLAGMAADQARIKYGCAKVLRLISAKAPRLLYPDFEFFAGLLGQGKKFLQWDAATIIANLATVDTRRKFEPIFRRYFAPISGPVMITAANVIGGAAVIACAKPELADRIAAEILKVEKARYATAECRNVAIGQAIKSLDLFFEDIREKGAVSRFVRRQMKNRRRAVREAAEGFLERH